MSETDGIDELESYEDAAKAGDLELDEKTVTFDSDNDLSQSAKMNIRSEARNIENANNGIDDITIEFDTTNPVAVDSQ